MNNEFHDIKANFVKLNRCSLIVEIDDQEYCFPACAVKHEFDLFTETGQEIEFQAQAWILIKNDLEWMVEA